MIEKQAIFIKGNLVYEPVVISVGIESDEVVSLPGSSDTFHGHVWTHLCNAPQISQNTDQRVGIHSKDLLALEGGKLPHKICDLNVQCLVCALRKGSLLCLIINNRYFSCFLNF